MDASWIFGLIFNWWTAGQILVIIFVGVLKSRYLSRWMSKEFPSVLLPEGEYVLITGCDSGIGHETAKLMDSLGFNVFAGCLFPNGPGATQLIKEASDKLLVVSLDITDEQSVNNCFDRISQHTKEIGLWGLVNNAGVLCYGYLEWLTWNQCQKQVDVNLLGTIRVTRMFLPLIQKRKGRILTISSLNGMLAYPALSIYSATKFALEGFCDSLRLEMRRHNVKVIVIQLGDFAKLTGIFSSHKRDAQEMWDSMSDLQKEHQREFFWKFHQDAEENCGKLCPLTFRDSPLRSVLIAAATSRRPASHYLCMPYLHKVIIRLLLLCPKTFSDVIMSRAFKVDSM